jgi:probable addiction module antidote protein
MEKNPKIKQWDTAEFLDDQADIDAYLQVAFESGDPHQITKALGNAARANSMLEVANKTGLTREHLYTSLSESGNPTLQTLTKIMDALGYQLSFVPKTKRKHTS